MFNPKLIRPVFVIWYSCWDAFCHVFFVKKFLVILALHGCCFTFLKVELENFKLCAYQTNEIVCIFKYYYDFYYLLSLFAIAWYSACPSNCICYLSARIIANTIFSTLSNKLSSVDIHWILIWFIYKSTVIFFSGN